MPRPNSPAKSIKPTTIDPQPCLDIVGTPCFLKFRDFFRSHTLRAVSPLLATPGSFFIVPARVQARHVDNVRRSARMRYDKVLCASIE